MFVVFIYLFLCILKYHRSEGSIVVRSILSNSTVDVFYDSEAFFGTRLTVNETLSGFIVAGNPLNGCVDALPYPIRPIHTPLIALVVRGDCAFYKKALAAERGRFAALVVFNDKDDSTFPMSSDSTIPIGIPAVMVGLSAGVKIKNTYCLQDNETYLVTIHPNPDAYMSPFLVPVVSVAIFLLVCTIAFYTFRVYLRYRVRRRRCLTAAQLNKLPVIVFVKNERSEGTCAICLEEFVDQDKLRLLPCHHVYHCQCVDHWLLSGRRVCPICKRPAYGRGRRRYRNLSTSDTDYEDNGGANDEATSARSQGRPAAYGAVSGLPGSADAGTSTASEVTETTPLLAVTTGDTGSGGNRRKFTWQWPWQKLARKRLATGRMNSTSPLSGQQSSTVEYSEGNAGAPNSVTVSVSHSSPTLPNVEVPPSARQLNMVHVIVHRTATPDDENSSSV